MSNIGDSLLAVLGGALPGYIQGKQDKMQREQQAEQERKLREKEQKQLTSFEMQTATGLQKLILSPDVTPETKATAQQKFNELYNARAAGQAPTSDSLTMPNAQYRGVQVTDEIAAGNQFIPNQMVGENLTYDQFIGLQREQDKLQAQEQQAFQKRQKEALELQSKYDGVTPEDQQYYLQTGFLPNDALNRFKAKPKTDLADIFNQAVARVSGTETAKSKLRLKDIEDVSMDVSSIFDTFTKIPESYRGAFAGRTVGQLGKFAKTDANLVAYENTKELSLANIAKKLGGEVGVLTDKDIERIKNALPALSDSEASAQLKMRYVFNYIDRRVKSAQEKAGQAPKGIGLSPEMIDDNFDPNQIIRAAGQGQSSRQAPPPQLDATDQYLLEIQKGITQ